MMRIALTLVLAAATCAAQKPVVTEGFKPALPFSPGMDAGTLVYVSGQGAQDAKGQIPTGFEAQARQTLENVQAVVKAAGLSMEHVVFAQAYLADMKNYDTFNKVWSQFFPKNPPARSTIGVTRMPLGTPVEISAVAVRDLSHKKVLSVPNRPMPVPISAAIDVGSRVFMTGGLGRDASGKVPSAPREQVKLVMESATQTLKQANLELRHMIYATVYVSPKMPMKLLAEAIDYYLPEETARTVVQTAALPFGVDLQITGVASRDIKRLGKCTGVKDTVYCSGRAGSVRQVLTTLKQDLEANGSSMEKAVAVTIYIDDLDEFDALNKIYPEYFGKTLPTRTTLQPFKNLAELSLPAATGVPEDSSPRCQIAIVGVR